MALTDDAFLHACLRLHHAYPYDARVARLAIQALQRKGELRRAGELARRMSERLLAKGMGAQALGFVEIARKFLGDSPELDREAEMARLAVGAGGPAEVPHFELIEALSDEEAAAFLRRGRLVPAQKDEVVVREGERDRVFYLILSGEFDVMLANEARVGSLHAGEFFGEAACIYGLPRTASVVARTEAELLAFSEEAVQALAREFPLAGDYLKRVVDRRLIMTLTYQHPAFAEVPPGDRAWVADEAAIEDWREGETQILSQAGDALWIVFSGEVQLVRMKDGRVRVATLGPQGVWWCDAGDDAELAELVIGDEGKAVATERTLVVRIAGHVAKSLFHAYAGFDAWIRKALMHLQEVLL